MMSAHGPPPFSPPPWWIAWLLHLFIAVATIFGAAVLLDAAWAYLTGNDLGAACGLAGLLHLLPLGLTIPAGLALATGGFLLAILGHRVQGVALICLGALLASVIDLYEASGLWRLCG
jgi:hypothetical protein